MKKSIADTYMELRFSRKVILHSGLTSFTDGGNEGICKKEEKRDVVKNMV